MKKALLLIAVVAILSGCGTTDTLTCTADNTVGTLTSKSTYKIDYRDKEVKKLTVTYEYKDNHTDGVGTGTDGTTDDKNTDTDPDGVIDGVVGEALDDVVTGVTDTVLDIASIKDRHNTRFGTYTNTEGFMSKVDMDNDTDYKVTYTYDLSKLSDDDLTTFGISKDFDTQKNTYTNRGLTCK